MEVDDEAANLKVVLKKLIYIPGVVGPENLKKSKQKNSSNEMNHFHGIFLFINAWKVFVSKKKIS